MSPALLSNDFQIVKDPCLGDIRRQDQRPRSEPSSLDIGVLTVKAHARHAAQLEKDHDLWNRFRRRRLPYRCSLGCLFCRLLGSFLLGHKSLRLAKTRFVDHLSLILDLPRSPDGRNTLFTSVLPGLYRSGHAVCILPKARPRRGRRAIDLYLERHRVQELVMSLDRIWIKHVVTAFGVTTIMHCSVAL